MPEYELVRVDRQIAEQLMADPSNPVVVVSLTCGPDGTSDMLFQTPALTEAMVERAARALHDAVCSDVKWPEPHGADWWKHCAETAVAAALIKIEEHPNA